MLLVFSLLLIPRGSDLVLCEMGFLLVAGIVVLIPLGIWHTLEFRRVNPINSLDRHLRRDVHIADSNV
jgi:hypothetical protein